MNHGAYSCQLSANMTPRKCETLQRSNRECINCSVRMGQGILDRAVVVNLPLPVWDWLSKTGMEVEDALVDLAFLASEGKLSVDKSAL